MGLRERTDAYFRKRLVSERELRGWSQAEVANRLKDNGIDWIHSSSIAKIETDKRSVQLAEAIGLADLFGLSLDALLGRKGMEDDASHAMTVLADEAQKAAVDLAEIRERLRLAYQDLRAQFDFAGFEKHVGGGATWSDVDIDSDEHRRAMLMWTCRDAAVANMDELIGLLVGVVALRSMSLAGVREYWEQTVAMVPDNDDEGEK
jgi:transcriptional regulator with XRE-family HTH domain